MKRQPDFHLLEVITDVDEGLGYVGHQGLERGVEVLDVRLLCRSASPYAKMFHLFELNRSVPIEQVFVFVTFLRYICKQITSKILK